MVGGVDKGFVCIDSVHGINKNEIRSFLNVKANTTESNPKFELDSPVAATLTGY